MTRTVSEKTTTLRLSLESEISIARNEGVENIRKTRTWGLIRARYTFTAPLGRDQLAHPSQVAHKHIALHVCRDREPVVPIFHGRGRCIREGIRVRVEARADENICMTRDGLQNQCALLVMNNQTVYVRTRSI
jgi:hypothetical protein